MPHSITNGRFLTDGEFSNVGKTVSKFEFTFS